MHWNKLKELRRIFEEFDSPVASAEYAADIPEIVRKAAVLILLRWSDSESCWQVFFTVRSQNVSTHQGEVAFPGGMRDATDHSPVETALREAFEEVGLPSRYVHVVGTSRPFRTRYNFALYPVVGVLDSDVTFEPFPNEEVSACFWLPLARFLSAEGHSMHHFNVNGLHLSSNMFEDNIDGCDDPVITWGITSFMAIVVAMIIQQRKPEYNFPSVWTLHDKGSQLSFDANWSQIAHAILANAMSAVPPTATTHVAKL